jgi:hypothetical protein
VTKKSDLPILKGSLGKEPVKELFWSEINSVTDKTKGRNECKQLIDDFMTSGNMCTSEFPLAGCIQPETCALTKFSKMVQVRNRACQAVTR